MECLNMVVAGVTLIIAAFTLSWTKKGVNVVKDVHQEQTRANHSDRLRHDVVLASRIRAELRKKVGLKGDEAIVEEHTAEDMRSCAYQLETEEAADIKEHLLDYFGTIRKPPKRTEQERDALKKAMEDFVRDHARNLKGRRT